VGWARRCRAARACQKSAKSLRRRGKIRRNQPRDVTEFNGLRSAGPIPRKVSNNVGPATSRFTRSKAIARAPAGKRTKTLKNRPRTAPQKAPPVGSGFPFRCLPSALCSLTFLARRLCLAWRLCGVHHNISLKARSRKVLFLGTFGVERLECLGKAR
jgi:hypothetical protein